MEQLVRTTLELRQYQCNGCGLLFYFDRKDDNTEGLGCPYGCDKEVELTRIFNTEIKKVDEVFKNE